MAEKIEIDESITLDMAGFIAADIADGAVLRKFDMDTLIRRVADGIIDHLSVGRVSFEIAQKHPSARPYFAALATRAALVGVLNATHLLKTGEATKGEWNQKSTNLATAALVLIANTGNRRATYIAGLVASGIAFSTAPAYLKGLGEKHEGGIRRLK